MVSPWDSQTLASPILWTAVKYIYVCEKDGYKNEDWDKDIGLFRLLVATF